MAAEGVQWARVGWVWPWGSFFGCRLADEGVAFWKNLESRSRVMPQQRFKTRRTQHDAVRMMVGQEPL